MLHSKRIENSASEANLIFSDIKQIYQVRILYGTRGTPVVIVVARRSVDGPVFAVDRLGTHTPHYRVDQQHANLPSIRGFLCIPFITV